MPQPIFVTGEAGSGKTRRLMERAAAIGSVTITAPHQRALAMAVMHGARRRLQSTLASYCPDLPVTVSTIHSFALGVVNRWRRSLGVSLPVTACETTCGLEERHLRTHATFDEVMELACRLLQSGTVQRALGQTYPLIIIDEFQDCTAQTLHFVKALGTASTLLLAADHFQMLQHEENGCPAVSWAETLKHHGGIQYEELVGCRRTDRTGILQAARALRDNIPSTASTAQVYYAPNVGPAACRMVGRFVSWAPDKITNGSCALIALSLDDQLLRNLLESFQRQLSKRNPKLRVHWSVPLPEEEQHQNLLAELGIDVAPTPGATWDPRRVAGGGQAAAVAREITYFGKLRGIGPIPQDLATEFAKLSVHNSRAFGWSSPRFQVLTVHGAKNREFDHVFVFWAFKAGAWSKEQQRRLLYNAVTRARLDCTVLVLGDRQRTLEDPVISLLGPALPAIDPAWKGRKKAIKAKP